MMEFWVVLAITYGAGFLEGDVSYVATPNQEACETLMQVTYDQLYPHFPGIMLQCIPTQYPSKSLRPKPRPEDLE